MNISFLSLFEKGIPQDLSNYFLYFSAAIGVSGERGNNMNKEQAQQLRKHLLQERKKLSSLAEEALRNGGTLCDPAVLEQATHLTELMVPLEESMPLPGAKKEAPVQKEEPSCD